MAEFTDIDKLHDWIKYLLSDHGEYKPDIRIQGVQLWSWIYDHLDIPLVDYKRLDFVPERFETRAEVETDALKSALGQSFELSIAEVVDEATYFSTKPISQWFNIAITKVPVFKRNYGATFGQFVNLMLAIIQVAAELSKAQSDKNWAATLAAHERMINPPPPSDPEGIDKIFKFVSEVVIPFVAADIIGETIADLFEGTGLEDIANDVSDKIDEVFDPAKVLGEVTSDTIDNILDEKRRDIVDSIQELDDDTILDLSSVVDGVNRGLRDITDTVAEGLGNIVGNVVTNLGDLINSIDKDLEPAEENMPQMVKANAILTGTSFGASLKALLFRKKG